MADQAASPRSMKAPVTAFAVGAAVALALGVFGRVHDPTIDGTTTLGYDTVLDMKVVVTALIGVLAILQLFGALWIYGKLGIKAPSWVGPLHRASGTLTVLLAIFVGYHCIWALGLEYGELHNGEPVPLRAVDPRRRGLRGVRRAHRQGDRGPLAPLPQLVPPPRRRPAAHRVPGRRRDVDRLVRRRTGLAQSLIRSRPPAVLS